MARRRPAPDCGHDKPLEVPAPSLSRLLQRLYADGKAWVAGELALSRYDLQDLLGRMAWGAALLALCHAVLLAGLILFFEGLALALGQAASGAAGAHLVVGVALLAAAGAIGFWAWHVMRPAKHLRSTILRWLLDAEALKDKSHD